MLKKLNYTLGILVIVGALVIGGYSIYQTKFAKVSDKEVNTMVEEVVG